MRKCKLLMKFVILFLVLSHFCDKRKSLRDVFQGAEMVVLPALLHLHLPHGHLLCICCQGLRLTLLQKGLFPTSFPIIFIRKII